MMCFALADRLGKSIQEVEDWPIDTIYEWAAYIHIVEERRKTS